MGQNRKIALSILLFFLLVACKNKTVTTDEMVYEEIVLCNSQDGRCYINLIAQNQSDYKRIVCFPNFVNSISEVKDHLYTNEDFRKFKIKFRKDTLSAFFMQIGGWRVDINSKVGTVFHSYYIEDASEEEKTESGILFESQIFDTVFNNIIHVKRCFHYSLIVGDEGLTPSNVKYHLYYDTDRYIFVKIELRSLETNELIDMNQVEKINRIDSSYFKENWDSTTETFITLMPEIRLSH